MINYLSQSKQNRFLYLGWELVSSDDKSNWDEFIGKCFHRGHEKYKQRPNQQALLAVIASYGWKKLFLS